MSSGDYFSFIEEMFIGVFSVQELLQELWIAVINAARSPPLVLVGSFRIGGGVNKSVTVSCEEGRRGYEE